MFLLTGIITALADMLWGGQFGKWLGGFDRIPAIIIIFAVFAFMFDVYLGAIAMTGYLAIRIAGWRFFANQELFLVMSKPKHVFYAFIHGLMGFVVPIIAHFAYGADFIDGLIYWTAISAVLAIASWVVINAVGAFKRDYLPYKEFVWGLIYGVAAYQYLAQI